jgi:hypothetical protein
MYRVRPLPLTKTVPSPWTVPVRTSYEGGVVVGVEGAAVVDVVEVEGAAVVEVVVAVEGDDEQPANVRAASPAATIRLRPLVRVDMACRQTG